MTINLGVKALLSWVNLVYRFVLKCKNATLGCCIETFKELVYLSSYRLTV